MKILLFGDTTATHALTWKLFDSPLVDQLLCAPGNGGTASVFAFDTDLDPNDESGAANFMFNEGIDLAIANQSAILSGVWDTAQLLNKPVLGAGRAVAPLLTNRIALKEWLVRHNVPALRGRVLSSADDAEKYAAGQPLPLQISAEAADGPSVVCHGRSELQAAVLQCMPKGTATTRTIRTGYAITLRLVARFSRRSSPLSRASGAASQQPELRFSRLLLPHPSLLQPGQPCTAHSANFMSPVVPTVRMLGCASCNLVL